jgi:peptidyl-dipeptidase Dcp
MGFSLSKPPTLDIRMKIYKTYAPRGICGLAIVAMTIAADLNANAQETKEPMENDAMLRPWSGPYGGVPPWHLVRPNKFAEAFDAAIGLADSEIAEIADSPDPPTFENTMVALESAGRALDRLEALFGVHQSNLNLGPIPDVERVVEPKLAEYRDRVTQNEKLFNRIAAVYESDEAKRLDPAQRRLVKDRYEEFVRRGAKLNAADKARLSRINQRLATLFTEFSQNVLADEQGYVTWIEDESDLAGLPESVVSAMASAAKERGGKAKWAVTNTRSSMDPFLTYASNRPLREQVWRRYYNRGDNGDQHDNNAIIAEILRLRAARAKLLGYETHAHWRLEPQMAKTPEATLELMRKVWPKAVARVREEVADMQEIADAEGDGVTIQPWDYRYYAEKVRKAKYDLDFNQVKPYLQLEKLREAMMWVAGGTVRAAVSPDQRRAGFPSGRSCLGGHQRDGRACRIVVSRSVRAAGEAKRRVDDRLSSTGEHGPGNHADRLQ